MSQCRDPLKVHRRDQQLQAWPIDYQVDLYGVQPWQERAVSTGLTYLQGLMYSHYDHALISAFVERWHPETNSFHMPWGEMTVTLHDVLRILALPIDGEPVYEDPSRGPPGHDKYAQAAHFFDMDYDRVKFEFQKGGFFYKTIVDMSRRKRWRGRHPEAAASLYLYYLLGSTLFTDKSVDQVPYRYLYYVYTVEDVGQYAWGTTALAFLYSKLGKATRREAAQLGGCMTLLQVFSFFSPVIGTSCCIWHIGIWHTMLYGHRQVLT